MDYCGTTAMHYATPVRSGLVATSWCARICTSSSGLIPKFLTGVRGPIVLEEKDWASQVSVGWSAASALRGATSGW